MLVLALTFGGAGDEAIAASQGLPMDAEATHNPFVIAWALLAYGIARRDTDPAAAYEVQRKALTIAVDTGNRLVESHLADGLSRMSATGGGPVTDAFDQLALAIRIHHDAGSFSLLLSPLASLAALFDRLERYEAAATISGFAAKPLTHAVFPEIHAVITHLRDVLGDETYESLARTGENMTNTAMASYALDQIDQARAQV